MLVWGVVSVACRALVSLLMLPCSVLSAAARAVASAVTAAVRLLISLFRFVVSVASPAARVVASALMLFCGVVSADVVRLGFPVPPVADPLFSSAITHCVAVLSVTCYLYVY